MNILSTQYTLINRALEIYLSGCKGKPHCPGCHNPESWDFVNGIKYDKDYLMNISSKINNFDKLIQNIMIFGGEPFDQDVDDLWEFIKDMTALNKKLWVFTRYGLKTLFQKFPKELICAFDYIKCGRYIEELRVDNKVQYGIKLATSNQHIYKKGIDY